MGRDCQLAQEPSQGRVMSIQTVATAESYAVALNALTGTPATAKHALDYSEVYFSDPAKTRAWIEDQLKPGPPGAVRIDFMPVILPVVLKRAVPVALGLVALGYLLGKIR
jgi:hypothetical protein